MASITKVAGIVGITKQALSEHLKKWEVDYQSISDSELVLMYCSHLRDMAANAAYVDDEIDGRKEKALKDRVERQLSELKLAEARGVLVNVASIEEKYRQRVSACKAELLARDEKLKTLLFTVYGADVDIAYLNEFTNAALIHLAGQEG
jgi:DNA-binding transcriptional ArsR family regulator